MKDMKKGMGKKDMPMKGGGAHKAPHADRTEHGPEMMKAMKMKMPMMKECMMGREVIRHSPPSIQLGRDVNREGLEKYLWADRGARGPLRSSTGETNANNDLKSSSEQVRDKASREIDEGLRMYDSFTEKARRRGGH